NQRQDRQERRHHAGEEHKVFEGQENRDSRGPESWKPGLDRRPHGRENENVLGRRDRNRRRGSGSEEVAYRRIRRNAKATRPQPPMPKAPTRKAGNAPRSFHSARSADIPKNISVAAALPMQISTMLALSPRVFKTVKLPAANAV